MCFVCQYERLVLGYLFTCAIYQFLSGSSTEHGDFLHAITANPISLFSMPLNGDSFYHMDLDHLYPSTRGLWRPQLTPASLGGHNAGKIVLHEAEVSSSYQILHNVLLFIGSY